MNICNINMNWSCFKIETLYYIKSTKLYKKTMTRHWRSADMERCHQSKHNYNHKMLNIKYSYALVRAYVHLHGCTFNVWSILGFHNLHRPLALPTNQRVYFLTAMQPYQQYLRTSSTNRRGIWKKLSNNFSFTWVCKSGKHSFMLRSTSLLSCEHIDPLIHESFEVPSLLCSHNEVSLSRTFAIFSLILIFSL